MSNTDVGRLAAGSSESAPADMTASSRLLYGFANRGGLRPWAALECGTWLSSFSSRTGPWQLSVAPPNLAGTRAEIPGPPHDRLRPQRPPRFQTLMNPPPQPRHRRRTSVCVGCWLTCSNARGPVASNRIRSRACDRIELRIDERTRFDIRRSARRRDDTIRSMPAAAESSMCSFSSVDRSRDEERRQQ